MPGANFRLWDRFPSYGDTLYKRATGELPEMESSKALALHAKKKIRPGDRVLDCGCGAGHYLRSLRGQIKAPFNYVGMDLTEYFIQAAKKAWAADPAATFLTGDIYKIPFAEKTFDTVICCNLILHLPAMAGAVAELLRVTKKWVIIRTLISERSFITKEVLEAEAGSDSDFDETGAPRAFAYYNIYSKKAVTAAVHRSQPGATIQFIEDSLYDQEAIARDARNVKSGNPTTMIGKFQSNGCILLPWHFVIMEKA